MATEQQQPRRRAEADKEADTPQDATESPDADTVRDAAGDDLDALLDEIDEVLEENPEDFVRNYVQKGGQ